MILTPATATRVKPDRIPSARARALYDWWTRQRGTRAMPSRREFLAEDLVPWWPDLILYEIVPDGARMRFRFRVHGANAVVSDGGNFTGRHLDEVLPPEMAPPVIDCYRAVAETGLPLFSIGHRRSLQGYDVRWERLLVPIGENAATHVLAFLVRQAAAASALGDDLLGATHTRFVYDMLVFVEP
jgi:hypothetical protein